MNNLPRPNSLKQAVDLVIQQNKSIKYNPARFIGKLQGLTGMALTDGIAELIKSENAVSSVFDHLKKYKGMWTIEDFVIQQGQDWGFDLESINSAQRNVEIYDHRRKSS